MILRVSSVLISALLFSITAIAEWPTGFSANEAGVSYNYDKSFPKSTLEVMNLSSAPVYEVIGGQRYSIEPGRKMMFRFLTHPSAFGSGVEVLDSRIVRQDINNAYVQQSQSQQEVNTSQTEERGPPPGPAPPSTRYTQFSEEDVRAGKSQLQSFVRQCQGVSETSSQMAIGVCSTARERLSQCESNSDKCVPGSGEFEQWSAALSGGVDSSDSVRVLEAALAKCQQAGELNENQARACSNAEVLRDRCKRDANSCDGVVQASSEIDRSLASNEEPGGDTDESYVGPGEVTPEELVSVDTLLQRVEHQRLACEESESNAIRCCGQEALSCVDGGNGSQEAQMAAVIAQIGSMYASGNQAGLKAQCDTLRNMQTTNGLITGRVAQVCSSKRSSCESSCSSYRMALESLKHECGDNNENCINHINARITGAQGNVNTCNDNGQLNYQQQQMAAGSASAFANATVAQQCSGAVESQSVADNPNNPLINPQDCSAPENASNPYCQAQLCSQPGASSLPQCNQGSNPSTPPPTGGFSNNDTIGGDNSTGGSFSDPFGPSVSGGDPSAGSAAIEPNRLASTPGGSGGGSGAPGSAGGSSGGAAQGSSGLPDRGGSGPNTDILKGTRGGSGYSVSKGSFSSGGGGYSYGRGGDKKKSKYKPFNLKDFLPGGKKDPRKKAKGFSARGVASTTQGKIHVSHSDIWKKMSSKYTQVCLRKQLTCSGRKSRFPLNQ